MFALTVLIAHSLQKSTHDSNGVSYDIERQKLGIYAIGQFERFEEYEWERICQDNTYQRWKAILANTELSNEYHYYYNESKDSPYHESKRIVHGTQLFFWNNLYAGELDMFIKPIDSLRHIELEVIYFSKETEHGGKFYAYIDTIVDFVTIDENAPELFFCGTGDDEHIERGDITKEEADAVLKNWGLLK
jgi:hypothetical protein